MVVVAATLLADEASALDCAQAITTPEINECASIEQQEVETQLNATYQKVLAFLDQADPLIKDDAARAKAKLMEAQRTWIKFREADCDAVYNLNASGTIRNVMRIGCMQAHGKQRIGELNGLIEGGG